MTETLQDPPPSPPPPTSPPVRARLARDPDDKVVAGVCAALARYTDTDPVLWRVLFAALVLFGGTGLALYLLAWLLIPRTDQAVSFVERHLRRPNASVSASGVVLLALIALVIFGFADIGSGLFVLVVVGGLAYLVFRERRALPDGGTGGPGAVPATPWVPTGHPSSYGVPPAPAQAYDPPLTMAVAPEAPKPRSVLGPVTLSTAALVAGVLLLLRELGASGITGPRVLAATILVVGAGLVVGTWLGRARWLLVVGLVLGLALAATQLSTTLDGRLSGGTGERTWVPTSSSGTTDFKLGAGEATLDLRRLEPGAVEAIRAEVGMGSLIVLVPDGLPVRIRTDIGLGEVTESAQGSFGVDERRASGENDGVLELGPDTGPALELDLQVGLGEIEVRRVQR